jgi:type I restriction enzyme S subunit
MMIKIQEHNAPALRFPEFSSDWETKKLSDFFTFKNGVNADKSKYGFGYKFINVLDIIADHPITQSNIIGSVAISKKEFEKNEVVFGDILFQRSSETREEVGQSNVYLDKENSATFGGFVIRGRPITEINSEYFDALLKTCKVRKEITTRSGGSTRYNVGQQSLSVVLICISSSLYEQQKIASFLTSVDTKIEQLGKKKSLLEQYKKGMMQKLFSQTLRFKDEQENDFPDWEENKLDAMTTVITKGTTPTSVGFSFENNGINFIKAESLDKRYNVIDNKMAKVSIECHNALKRSQIEEDDILFSIAGTLGRSAIARKANLPANTNQAISIIRLNNKKRTHFVNYFLNSTSIRKRIKQILSVGAQPNLSLEQVGQFKIHLPRMIEQQKIANLLSALDQKIDYITTELNLAKTFKKGLLQQMFV